MCKDGFYDRVQQYLIQTTNEQVVGSTARWLSTCVDCTYWQQLFKQHFFLKKWATIVLTVVNRILFGINRWQIPKTCLSDAHNRHLCETATSKLTAVTKIVDNIIDNYLTPLPPTPPHPPTHKKLWFMLATVLSRCLSGPLKKS